MAASFRTTEGIVVPDVTPDANPVKLVLDHSAAQADAAQADENPQTQQVGEDGLPAMGVALREAIPRTSQSAEWQKFLGGG